jgi:MscS family membrane protein
MREFLDQEFFNNTVEAYLTVACIILFALLIKRLISKYIAGLLFRLFKTENKFHKQSFLDLIIQPLESFLIVVIIVVSCDKLTFPDALEFTVFHKIGFHDLIESLINAALIITFIRLCIRITKYVSLILGDKASGQSGNQLIVFFSDFFRVILILIGGLLLLHFSLHYQIGNLLTGLSLVGAAIALATKESLENLIASFIIFTDKPFSVGDTVKVQGFTGAIEKIGLRSTRIRTDQKTFITVPNKQMVDTIIDNVSLRTQRRATLSLEVSLSVTTENLQNIIEEIKTILQKKDVESSAVFLSDTGKNAHIITIEYFATIQQTLAEFRDLKQQINLQIIDLFNKNKIDFAASSTDVVVTQKQ